MSPSKTPLLDTISTPADLRRLNEADLVQLANELRTETIDAVSVTGGHLGGSASWNLRSRCIMYLTRRTTGSFGMSDIRLIRTRSSLGGAAVSEPCAVAGGFLVSQEDPRASTILSALRIRPRQSRLGLAWRSPIPSQAKNPMSSVSSATGRCPPEWPTRR